MTAQAPPDTKKIVAHLRAMANCSAPLYMSPATLNDAASLIEALSAQQRTSAWKKLDAGIDAGIRWAGYAIGFAFPFLLIYAVSRVVP